MKLSQKYCSQCCSVVAMFILSSTLWALGGEQIVLNPNINTIKNLDSLFELSTVDKTDNLDTNSILDNDAVHTTDDRFQTETENDSFNVGNHFYTEDGSFDGEPVPISYDTLLEKYVGECRAAGVPIPPPFAEKPWEHVGNLAKDKIFIAADYHPLEIWRYKPEKGVEPDNPVGMCSATVRYKKNTSAKDRIIPEKTAAYDKNNNNVEAIGIICQAKKKPGNACFWVAREKVVGEEVKTMDNGYTIKEETEDGRPLNCTLCHRGNNAFNVHPGTVLDKITETPSGDWYTPLPKSRPNWENPESNSDYGDCLMCHGFATVTKGWCEDVLNKTLGKTMPLKHDWEKSEDYSVPPDWKTDEGFKKGVQQFKKECEALNTH